MDTCRISDGFLRCDEFLLTLEKCEGNLIKIKRIIKKNGNYQIGQDKNINNRKNWHGQHKNRGNNKKGKNNRNRNNNWNDQDQCKYNKCGIHNHEHDWFK